MLYDPKWQKPADVMSLDSLITWLEKQPADRAYNYMCLGHCMVAQYLKAQGYLIVSVGGCSSSFSHLDANGRLVDDEFPATFDNVALRGNATFGAALERARAMQTSALGGEE